MNIKASTWSELTTRSLLPDPHHIPLWGSMLVLTEIDYINVDGTQVPDIFSFTDHRRFFLYNFSTVSGLWHLYICACICPGFKPSWWTLCRIMKSRFSWNTQEKDGAAREALQNKVYTCKYLSYLLILRWVATSKVKSSPSCAIEGSTKLPFHNNTP